ncbi:FAD-binding oxidoreductase [Streptomyces sp. NPDC017529]|uniref:FAD-binding oxidoreductase n=1 Tax=Streptomyces sp. NPDC017529 TaxID=3365000 RepID=UPI0037AEBCDF
MRGGVGGAAPPLPRPGSDAYAAAVRAFNLAAPLRPDAAVVVRSVDDIRLALGRAEAEGLRPRVHTTGHAAGSAGSMAGALLLRVAPLGRVEVDALRRTARIPAGTPWSAVVAEAAAHGLAVAHGSSPTVGAVGYLLRGGVSFYGRSTGLASNRVRAIELVTADGRLRHAGPDSDPELLWALRGGGGGFGVVTSVEVELLPVRRVVAGTAFWPAECAGQLLDAWLRWCRTAPPEATTSLRVMNLPPVPGIPPSLTEGPVLGVDGVVIAPDDDLGRAHRVAAGLLDPLRAVAGPLLDTWTDSTPEAVPAVHMDPVDPVPVHGDHLLLADPGATGAETFLHVVGTGSASPLVSAELRQLGAALGRPDPHGGVLDHLDASFAYIGAGIADSPAARNAVAAHLRRVRTALRPWDTGRTAPTFVETAEQPQGHLEPSEIHELDRIRARVDPDGVFRHDVMRGTSAR